MSRHMIVTLIIAILSLAAGFGAAMLQPAHAQIPYVPKGVTVYLGTFITGPNSTEFTLIDQSRTPAVKYTCAFTPPHRISATAWIPYVQCNR